MDSFLGKRRRTENYSKHFLYFPAIQGHPGGALVDASLQENVLLPDDFAEHIYHVGNAHDMHSMILNGLIPGGRSLKRDRQSVFFTAMNPVCANQDQEEVPYDLDKPRITVCFDVMKDIDSVPSNVQSARREALLHVFEDNEAVIKMIMKGRSPTMRHVSGTHRVALDWLFDRINLDPKIQIKYIDTKNQLADTLTKGNFTRDEWNHLLCLFNISHFSSTVCSEAMTKIVQQDSREEKKVTAKSRPMMSLIARAPSTLSSSASESPGKKSYGSQSPWSADAEKEDRTVQPVVDCHKQIIESSYSARYSRWDDDKAWSSQEWTAEIKTYDRYGENFRISSLSYDMEGHAPKCVERYCELANKATNNSTKYLLHALMTCQIHALKLF